MIDEKIFLDKLNECATKEKRDYFYIGEVRNMIKYSPKKENIIEGIKEIVKEDNAHNLEFRIDQFGLKVYLIWDENNNGEENFIIPIYCNILDGLCYIPQGEFKETYKDEEYYGIDLKEIEIVYKIMEYMELHKEEISDICYGCNWEDRENKED